jgi:plasmid maintenance system killer protein
MEVFILISILVSVFFIFEVVENMKLRKELKEKEIILKEKNVKLDILRNAHNTEEMRELRKEQFEKAVRDGERYNYLKAILYNCDNREMIIDKSVLEEISLCEIEIEAENEKREKIKLVPRLRKV